MLTPSSGERTRENSSNFIYFLIKGCATALFFSKPIIEEKCEIVYHRRRKSCILLLNKLKLIASRSEHVKFLPNKGGPLVSGTHKNFNLSMFLMRKRIYVLPDEETNPRRLDITE